VNKVSPNTTLTKASYQVVKVAGAQGQRLAVNLARANTDLNSADTLGVVTETIAPNQEGFILTVGQLEGVNTTGSLQGETWNDGDVLYLSPTTAGRMTNVKPNGSTGHIVVLGYVEYSHAINGKIYVKIMNGWELDELHNVYINPATLANNDALVYESSTQLWKNKQIFPITVGTAGSVAMTIAATGAANLQSLTGHSFTIVETLMPVGSTITVNGFCERTSGTSANGGFAYDVNGVKRYYNTPSGHQYQYQFTIYRESSTVVRMMGGAAGTLILGSFASGNTNSTTATVTPGGNIVLQLFGFGSAIGDVITYRFFKAILNR
jgi:hypothetical protein